MRGTIAQRYAFQRHSDGSRACPVMIAAPRALNQGLDGNAVTETGTVTTSDGWFVFNGSSCLAFGQTSHSGNFFFYSVLMPSSDISSLQGVFGAFDTAADCYGLYIDSGQWHLMYHDADNNIDLKIGPVVDSAVYDIAGVFDRESDTCNIYINGLHVLETSISYAPGSFAPNNYVRMGASADGGNNPVSYYTGSAASALVMDKIPSSDEILALAELTDPSASGRWGSIYLNVNAGAFEFTWNGPHLWLFPDGTTSTENNPSKTLTESGKVELRVPSADFWSGYSLEDSNSDAFVTTWQTTSPGETITLPLVSGYSYDFHVDWGDSSSNDITAYNDPNITHTYTSAGTHTVTITGDCPAWSFANGGDKAKIRTVDFGSVIFSYLMEGFRGCTGLTGATGRIHPDASLTEVDYIFYGCTSLTSIPTDLFILCINICCCNRAFTTCPSLVISPDGLFDSFIALSDARRCFYNDTSLSGNSGEYWLTGATGTECYTGCTGLDDYDDIPDDWK